jgi:hypothetical protein
MISETHAHKVCRIIGNSILKRKFIHLGNANQSSKELGHDDHLSTAESNGCRRHNQSILLMGQE